MQLGAVLVAMPLASAPAHAGEWAYAPFDVPPATYTGDAGVRFWYGHSSTAKNLYDNTGSLLVSRLTYDGLSIYAAEGLCPLRSQPALVRQGLCRRRDAAQRLADR